MTPGPQIATLVDDSLPISGLQHLAFCPRQWALIHLEQVWSENRLTAEGRLLHEQADLPGQTRRRELRTVRGMMIESRKLRLTGRADIVEFRPQPYPVEYKRGKRKPNDCDLVQLCAQALCLEEMLETAVPEGAIFYGDPRRRLEVSFTEELRARTRHLAEQMHRLYANGTTPAAQPGKHCRNCSLVDRCLPEATEHNDVLKRWSTAQIRALKAEDKHAEAAQHAARHDARRLSAPRW
ncbi:CRISPR-associated protein Cas4 [Granulicella cerasi]|uniref:CRISPR-associated exonuclease Cas4 n=1 Tax=Granulicella cerasi TaxID=741063 RepID=A0ABW1Z8N4_9BACT|nr:CRISPR-associated protein Cas4 [Granulicella cerasi]